MSRSPRGLGPEDGESRRLVDGAGTVKERLLLQAGIDEAPPNAAGRRRALAALGIALGTSTVASTATAELGRSVAIGQAKWIVFGAVGAALAVGAVDVATGPGSVRAPAPSVATSGRKATTAARGLSPIESATSPMRPSNLPAPQPSLFQNHAPPSAAPARALRPVQRHLPSVELPLTTPVERASSAPELVAQVAALDGARAALRAGRAEESLSLLDRFERSYPRSHLGPEATVVRVTALLALGQRAQATGLVRDYCRSGGRGAYGQRLTALMGLSQSACDGFGPGP